MKSVEQCSIPKQTPTGFNDGMDVIKPRWGLGRLRVYVPAFHAGLLKLKPSGLLERTVVIPNSRLLIEVLHTKQIRLEIIAIHTGDIANADAFGAGGFAVVGVRTRTESFGVHLIDHGNHAAVALGLTLR